MTIRRLLSLAAGWAMLAAQGAWAQEVVFDAPPNNDLTAFVDQQFADFPDFSTYLVAHVTLDRDMYIYDITTYFTNDTGLWPIGTISAVLNIIPQEFDLPDNGHDPSEGADGMKVEADLAGNGERLSLTTHLDGDMTLTAGDYWIGLTSSLDFGQFGQEFHKGSDIFEKNTAARNPGGGFGLGTDWFEAGPVFGDIDWGMALTVTAKNVPTPGALGLLGVAGLAARRRR